MVKYYYDTGVFGYFVFLGDWEHEYSPVTKGFAYASVFCDEELIFVYMKRGEFKDLGVKLAFVDMVDRLSSAGAFFKKDEIDLTAIYQKFLYMMGSLKQNNVDIRSDFVNWEKDKQTYPKPLDGMDWLHLAVADLLGYDVILTTDGGFKYLDKVGKYLRLEKVKKVIILSSDKALKQVGEVLLA